MSDRWKDFAVNAAEVALSFVVLYVMTPDAGIQTWRTASRVCQAVARRFGSWGLSAERRYMELAEKGRMI